MLAKTGTTVHAVGMDLLKDTVAMLHSTRLPYAQIARELEVSPRWLYKIRGGETSDPGVRMIQRLHDYLAAHTDRAA